MGLVTCSTVAHFGALPGTVDFDHDIDTNNRSPSRICLINKVLGFGIHFPLPMLRQARLMMLSVPKFVTTSLGGYQ